MVPAPWREINTMTIAFGHGIAVSPLQMANAVAAVVNGGIMRDATLLRRDAGEVPGERVLSQATSDQMRWLMRLVVQHGTGRNADVPGYMVGGKTGTAEKIGDRGYRRKALLSSFVGAFPINNPRYVVIAMLDEPQPTRETYGYATGGWVAAPVVKNVVSRMAAVLGLPPIDEQAPEVKQEMYVNISPRGRTLASF